ncbi:MAG: type II toxin-antitoxin system VapC family toxin [Planctomycetota bacterium]
MTPAFADTWYYVGLFNRKDAAHARAKAWSETSRRPLVSTEFVLLELGNAFARGKSRARFLALVKALRRDPGIEIVPASTDLLDRGIELFGEREDKEWSLTDCTSFVVMTERGMTDALTGDHHFEQAGFRALLAER